MTSVFSWQNSIRLCPASFCTPRPNLPVTPGYFLTPYFCIPVPYNEKDIFFLMLDLEGLVGLQRTIQLQLLQHYWLGIDLDYRYIEWFALKTNRDHSVVLRLHPSIAFRTAVDYDGYSISSNGLLPTVVDIMVI